MTSLTRRGNLFLVDTVVVGPMAHANTRLVLDTGAAVTTLAPRIATSIGCHPTRAIKPTVTRTAVAEVQGYLVRLELSALGFTMPAARVNVAEVGYDIDGLLGMNFLFGFNFEIRPADRCILLEKIVRG